MTTKANVVFFSHTSGGERSEGSKERPSLEYSWSKLHSLARIIRECPMFCFEEAIEKVRIENMCTMYDLAQIKSLFYEAGSEMQWVFKDGMIFGGFPYFWTNEYIGPAPVGHPAESQLIMATIEGLTSRRGNEGKWIIPSSTKYVLCPDVYQGPNERSRHIARFKKRGELMVPLPEKKWEHDSGKRLSPFGLLFLQTTYYCGAFEPRLPHWLGDRFDTGYLTERHEYYPMCYRPYSTGKDHWFCDNGPGTIYRVLRKDWIKDLL